MLIHVFTAGIVSIINLFHIAGRLDDPGVRAQVDEGRQYVRLAVRVLKGATNISFVAMRAVEVLEAMLEQEEARRSAISVSETAGHSRQARLSGLEGTGGPLGDDANNVFDGPVDWTAILNAMPSATTMGAVDAAGADANAAFWDGVANVDFDGMFAMGAGTAEGVQDPTALVGWG